MINEVCYFIQSLLISGLMERWETLSLRAEEAQKISAIHREIAALKLEFCAAHERLASYRVVLEEPQIIEDQINRITVSSSFSLYAILCILKYRVLWDVFVRGWK